MMTTNNYWKGQCCSRQEKIPQLRLRVVVVVARVDCCLCFNNFSLKTAVRQQVFPPFSENKMSWKLQLLSVSLTVTEWQQHSVQLAVEQCQYCEGRPLNAEINPDHQDEELMRIQNERQRWSLNLRFSVKQGEGRVCRVLVFFFYFDFTFRFW